MHTCTIKVTFAINSILKLSHKKLSSTKLEKNRNLKVIVKFMKQFCYTQRLIAWHVKKKKKSWAVGEGLGMNLSAVGELQSTPGCKWEPGTAHTCLGCALVCMTNGDNIKSLFSSFQFFHFLFFSIWLSAFFFLLPLRAVNFARCRAKVKVRV